MRTRASAVFTRSSAAPSRSRRCTGNSWQSVFRGIAVTPAPTLRFRSTSVNEAAASWASLRCTSSLTTPSMTFAPIWTANREMPSFRMRYTPRFKAARHFEPTKRAPSVTDYDTIVHGEPEACSYEERIAAKVGRVTFALNVPGHDMHAFGKSAMSSPLLVIDVHSVETGDMCKLILKEYDVTTDFYDIGPSASPAECTDALESKNFFEQVQQSNNSNIDGRRMFASGTRVFAHLELKKDGLGQFTISRLRYEHITPLRTS